MVNIRDGKDSKEPEPSKNEPNQNPGFAKNRTEPNPKVKNVKEPEPNRTLQRKEPNKSRTQMSWFLLDSFTERNFGFFPISSNYTVSLG